MSTMSRRSGIDLVENLITNVEKHPPIYDKSLPEYKDVEKKEDIIEITVMADRLV
jgi:hypothetical protein